MNSCIYKIQNTVNGKFYIGSTNNWKRRLSEHKTRLKLNKHENARIQNSWNKYGKENFIFIVLEECKEEQLEKLENYYFYVGKPEFNICQEIRRPPDRSKSFTLISPDGLEYKGYQIKSFCLKHQLCKNAISLLLSNKGVIRSHKGWTKTREDHLELKQRGHFKCKGKTYKLVSPEGEVFKITNRAKFAREKNLCRSNLDFVCRGKQKSHKGWSLANEVEQLD